MYNEQDLEAIIHMLDAKINAEVSRISIKVDEAEDAQPVKEEHHHGRCDVGSPWATGTVRNCD